MVTELQPSSRGETTNSIMHLPFDVLPGVLQCLVKVVLPQVLKFRLPCLIYIVSNINRTCINHSIIRSKQQCLICNFTDSTYLLQCQCCLSHNAFGLQHKKYSICHTLYFGRNHCSERGGTILQKQFPTGKKCIQERSVRVPYHTIPYKRAIEAVT